MIFDALGHLALGQIPENIIYADCNYPWSEPARQKISPRLAVALIASGLFTPVLNPPTQITQFYESRWHQAWSEPIRQKPGLRVSLQQYIPSQGIPFPGPAKSLQDWYNWFNEPVRLKPGLKAYLQQIIAYHPRLLPNADVTLIMNALESNNDTALFGIVAYNKADKAIISIREIPATNAGAASIEEA